MLLRKKTKGYIHIPNGIVDITDPCYDKDTRCRINNIKVKLGTYRCRYWMGAELEEKDIEETKSLAKEFNRDEEEMLEMERRDIQGRCFVIEIQLKGRAFQLNSPQWEEIGRIGVDAGLAGFFWNKPDFTDEKWSAFCDSLDFDKSVWLREEMGFFCSSGYGDGYYSVYAIKEKGEIIALKICF